MPLTTPENRRRLFAISDWGAHAPSRVADDAPSSASPFAVDESSTAAREARALPISFSVIGPKRNEFTAQTGRAPIVKMSRTMPPTPVVAPGRDQIGRAHV